MRIIFVGLHNKEHMKPLDSKTKSGKLIDRIIKRLPIGHEIRVSGQPSCQATRCGRVKIKEL
jgi:hypothetical protein